MEDVSINDLLYDRMIFQKALNGDEQVNSRLYKSIKKYLHKQTYVWVNKLYQGNPNWYDDIFCEITLAYYVALKNYVPDKNIDFIAFFSKCLFNHMTMYYRKHIKKNIGICMDSIDRAIEQEDGNKTSLIDSIPVDEDKLLNVSMAELWHEVNSIESKHSNLILLKLQGLNAAEIAKRIGVSQSYASRILNKQIEKLASTLKTKEMYDVKLIKKTQRQYTDEEISLIFELKKTLTYGEIGKKFNVSASAITNVVYQHNQKSRKIS